MVEIVGKQVQKREASRQAILDAAEELFLTLGFRAARVDDIASKAGLTKGAVYFHFEDKESVLMEVLHRVRTFVLEPLVQELERSGVSPDDKIIAFLHRQAIIASLHPRKLLLTILLSIDLNGTLDAPLQYVKSGYLRLASSLEQVVAAGQESGHFRRDLGAKEVSGMFLAVNDGMMLEWTRRHGELDGMEMVRAMRAILWVGLAARNETVELPPGLTKVMHGIAKV